MGNIEGILNLWRTDFHNQVFVCYYKQIKNPMNIYYTVYKMSNVVRLLELNVSDNVQKLVLILLYEKKEKIII